MRVEIARVAGDGSVRRAALDTATRDDAAHWDHLLGQAALDSPPRYRPVQQQAIYLIEPFGLSFAVAEHDLTGALRELVMAVLAEGEVL